MARKTTTSTEVKQRWIDKTYKRYVVSLRQDTQGELINLVENRKKEGYSTSEIFAEALDKLKKED